MRTVFLISSLFFFYSCTKKGEEIPLDILSKNQMTKLLIDLHVYEAVAYRQIDLSHDSSTKLQAYFEKALLLEHKIEDSMYKKSMEYYVQHPGIMLQVYEEILDSLEIVPIRKKTKL